MIRVYYAATPTPMGNNRQRFNCWLNDGTPLGHFRSPVHDGARALIALGYDPDLLMTTASSSDPETDCWIPAPISHFAGLTVRDSDSSPAVQAPYVPRDLNGLPD